MVFPMKGMPAPRAGAKPPPPAKKGKKPPVKGKGGKTALPSPAPTGPVPMFGGPPK